MVYKRCKPYKFHERILRRNSEFLGKNRRKCIFFTLNVSNTLTFEVNSKKKKYTYTTISYRYICYSLAGRSVLGKTVPEVLSNAQGRSSRAVLKAEGTVFPSTDQLRLVNNILVFFFNFTRFFPKKPE